MALPNHFIEELSLLGIGTITPHHPLRPRLALDLRHPLL
jgi:hypothetical protein